VVKNKVAAPFKTAEFDIFFGQGISYVTDMMNVAIKHGVITKTGNTYSFEGQKLGVGLESARMTIENDKKLEKEIEKRLQAIEVSSEAE